MKQLIGGLSIIAALLASACGGSGSSTNTNTNNPPPSSSSPSTPVTGTTNVTITIPPGAAGLGPAAFGTNPLVIQPNTTVTWVNGDSVNHTTTSFTGAWDSGILAPGQSFSVTFPNPGRFNYFCEVHGARSMSGSVQVGTPPPPPPPRPTPTPRPTPSPVATVLVTIPPGATGRGTQAYSPNPVNITAGTLVVWRNDDTVAHTTTSVNGFWDSGVLRPGQSFSVFFERSGSFGYFCRIHGFQSMSGTVNVAPR